MKIDYLPIRVLMLCEERMKRASEKHTYNGVDHKGKDQQFDEHLRAALNHLKEHEKGSYDPDGTHFVGFVTRAMLAMDAILDGRVQVTCLCGSGETPERHCESCSSLICPMCSTFIDPPGSYFCTTSAQTECGESLRFDESYWRRTMKNLPEASSSLAYKHKESDGE